MLEAASVCSCANVTAFQAENIPDRRDVFVWQRLEESSDTVTVDGGSGDLDLDLLKPFSQLVQPQRTVPLSSAQERVCDGVDSNIIDG